MAHSIDIISKIKKIRKKGVSLREISRKLNIPESTVRYWCKGLKLSKTDKAKLEKITRDPYYGRRKENIEKQIKAKNDKITRLLNEGFDEISDLTKNELFLVGTALYWAEGFKKDTQVGFANSDYKMINIFIKWLKVCCGINKTDLLPRVTVNISHMHRINEIQNYWSVKTGIAQNQFRKPFYQNVKWQKLYKNENEYFGVLRIKVRRSIDLLRKIHGWIAGLSSKC